VSVHLHSNDVVLVVAVFLASAVEMVEALTIVLAVGVTRGWRSALEGVALALVALGALVALLGPALVHWVPLATLRLVVGALLLVFGLQWLRKAVLRAAGLKAKHDEDAIFARQVAVLSVPKGGVAGPASDGRPEVGPASAGPASADSASGRVRDSTAFVVAFKGVFLEGLEVVVVVITLGSTAHRLGLASVAAAAAVVVVGAIGVVVARQLSGVPENALKMGVGLMLVSFGTFWSGEGVGVRWPGSDLAVPVLVAVYGALAWLLVVGARSAAPTAGAHAD
jgi:uncharacterized membrane protein